MKKKTTNLKESMNGETYPAAAATATAAHIHILLSSTHRNVKCYLKPMKRTTMLTQQNHPESGN